MTTKDPWYITNNFKNFNNLKDLPGFGVMGLVLIKKTL